MKRKRILMIHLASILLIPITSSADGPNIEVIQTVGLESPVFDSPCDLTWGQDGLIYVLNCGSYTVSIFDSKWNEVGRIGRYGDGPGEISQPLSLDICGDEIAIQQATSREYFTLDGNYLRSERPPRFARHFCSHGDCFIATSNGGHRFVEWTHPRGEVISWRLPNRPRARWNILPRHSAADGAIGLAVDMHDGLAWSLLDDGTMGAELDFDLGRGIEWAGGGKSVISGICYDPERGYWVIHYPEIGGEGYLYQYSNKIVSTGRWALSDARAGDVYAPPDGYLYLVDGQSSIIYQVIKPE